MSRLKSAMVLYFLFVLTYLKDCFDLPGLINAPHVSLTQRKLEIPTLSCRMLHKTIHFIYFSFSGYAYDDFRDGSYCLVEMRRIIISDTGK